MKIIKQNGNVLQHLNTELTSDLEMTIEAEERNDDELLYDDIEPKK